jgi:hypothetical protein
MRTGWNVVGYTFTVFGLFADALVTAGIFTLAPAAACTGWCSAGDGPKPSPHAED